MAKMMEKKKKKKMRDADGATDETRARMASPLSLSPMLTHHLCGGAREVGGRARGPGGGPGGVEGGLRWWRREGAG